MRSEPIENHRASAICSSWSLVINSRSGRGAIRLVMVLSSGPAKGEALRFYYSPGHPFQDALIDRHKLPTEGFDMDTVVGRSFNVLVSTICQDDKVMNQLNLIE